MTQHILITGANRGIGLGMVRQFLVKDDNNIVFATARKPDDATDLNALAEEYAGRVHIIQLDINDSDSVAAAVEQVKSTAGKLDILVNNAGIFVKDDSASKLGSLAADDVSRNIHINAVAPLMVSQALVDLLKAGTASRIVMISSGMGSMEQAKPGSYAYRMSKAAMNMAARVLSKDLESAGITTITMHPGWVQTNMGGKEAALTPEESATGLVDVISNLTIDDNGSFLQWDGTSLPW
ncbi:MAG: SDR family oxidoreductase [Aggregatilineales bacterium]